MNSERTMAVLRRVYDEVHLALWATLTAFVVYFAVFVAPDLPRIHARAQALHAQAAAAELIWTWVQKAECTTAASPTCAGIARKSSGNLRMTTISFDWLMERTGGNNEQARIFGRSGRNRARCGQL